MKSFHAFMKHYQRRGSLHYSHCSQNIVIPTLLITPSLISMQLSSLFDEKCLELPYNELLEKCEEAFDKIQASTSQTRNNKTATQTQAQLKIWFIYRAGQVTASRFKSAVCTDMSQPSQSPIKTICYPHR